MTDRLDAIEKVVAAHLCTGCGVCAYLAPGDLRMGEVASVGRRPLPLTPVAVTGEPVAACPGRSLSHTHAELDGAPFGGEWGPVIAVYECWASQEVMRWRGSSGGVVSALAAHQISAAGAHGALQVRARQDEPLLNETVLSTSREEILRAAGSRYSPASPCERLDLVEHAPAPCVVVGKPCDIAATRAAAASRPALAQKIALTIAIFCAGTPSTDASRQVISSLGVDPQAVARLDYRGEGWPGEFRVRTDTGERAATSYATAWGHLTKHRQWRCRICPDHTGEFADLSVGDPWYRSIEEGEPGRSLVVVRTQRGHAALQAALAAGDVIGHRVPTERLRESQPSLEATRGAVWARVATMRLAGLPAPRFINLPSWRAWWRLGPRAKAGAVAGTLKRIRSRNLRQSEPRPSAPVSQADSQQGAAAEEHVIAPPASIAGEGEPPEVAIIAVTYNSSDHLRPFLGALPAAAASTTVTVTVVDNASTDGSPDLVRRLAPWAGLVPAGDNLGYAAAINLAIDRARPSIGYLIINPDAAMSPGAVRVLADALTGDPEAGIALPTVRDAAGRLKHSMRREPTLARALAETFLGGRHGSRRLGEIVRDPAAYVTGARPDWATGAAQLVRTEAAERVGRWDERFFLYSEETDYALRVRDAGYHLTYQPAASVTHPGGAMSRSPWLWSLVAINRVRQYAMRHSRAASRLYWGVVVTNEALRSLRRRPTHRAALRALWRVGPRALTDPTDRRSSRELIQAQRSGAASAARRR